MEAFQHSKCRKPSEVSTNTGSIEKRFCICTKSDSLEDLKNFVSEVVHTRTFSVFQRNHDQRPVVVENLEIGTLKVSTWAEM